jgi:uncharacterized protein YndB with AHSA1/START domain
LSTTIVNEDSFSVVTCIKASPEVLYRAWTDKAGVEGWLADEAEMDARVDGRYILKWPTPDGEFSARGKYLELVPGKRIVQTWESWGPEGRFEDGDGKLQIEFEALADGSTQMTQTEWSDAYKEKERLKMSVKGTIQSHETLASFVESSDEPGA